MHIFIGSKRGPFVGPNSINAFCGGTEVESIEYVKTDIKAGTLVKICRDADYNGFCDYLETKVRLFFF